MWLIAKTKPNQEKKAEFNLKNQGFNTYLPIIMRKRFYNNLWVDFSECLFSGYIFIDYLQSTNDLSKINNTFGISKLLTDHFSLKPYILSNQLIFDIKKRLNLKQSGAGSPRKFDKVEIASGKNNSLSGIFLENISNKRSKILINMLNSNREVIVNREDIQTIY